MAVETFSQPPPDHSSSLHSVEGGLSLAVRRRPGRYPFLERAIQVRCRALAVRREWIREEWAKTTPREHPQLVLKVKHNYCQIFRAETIEALLSEIEWWLHSPRAPYETNQYRTMAGAPYYRSDTEEATLTLCTLRDLTFLPHHLRDYAERPELLKDSYLWEGTLQVV